MRGAERALTSSIVFPGSKPDGIYPVRDEVLTFDNPLPECPKTSDTKIPEQLRADERLRRYIEEADILEAIIWFVTENLIPHIDDETIIAYNKEGATYFAELVAKIYHEFTGKTLQLLDVKVSTSTGEMSFGEVKADKVRWFSQSIEGKNIWFLEDINDSGRTLKYIYERAKQEGADITTVSLYQRLRDASLPALEHIPAIVLLHIIANGYFVGTGLDDGNNRFRDIDRLYLLEKVAINTAPDDTPLAA